MENNNKTVYVKHQKSFSNTKTGQAVDSAISTAIVVAVTLGTAYTFNVLVEKIEQKKLDRDVNKLFTKAKARYNNKFN